MRPSTAWARQPRVPKCVSLSQIVRCRALVTGRPPSLGGDLPACAEYGSGPVVSLRLRVRAVFVEKKLHFRGETMTVGPSRCGGTAPSRFEEQALPILG